MAPMDLDIPNFQPVLPRIKIINDSSSSLEEKLSQIAQIADVQVTSCHLANFEVRKSGCARAEWALRWLLERMKACLNGESKVVLSVTAWRLLQLLVLKVPAASAARLLNANQVLSIVSATLNAAAQSLELNGNGQAIDELADEKPSKKRKRGRQDKPATSFQTLEILTSLESVLNTFISMSTRGSTKHHEHDVVATQHMQSVLRTGTLEAAQVLGSWLRCLSVINRVQRLSPEGSSSKAMELFHPSPILKIWELRSHEHDDNLGSSAETFSKECLVPAVKLYACLIDEVITAPSDEANTGHMKTMLELLFARHLFVPTHASFSLWKDRKTPTSHDTKSRLEEYLEPLHEEITECTNPDKHTLLRTFPFILEEAVKLSSKASPKQQATELSWIQHVFAALSYCAGEAIPFSATDLPPTDHDQSPMTSMLRVIQTKGIKPSADFLESILFDYSGLIDVKERFAVKKIPLSTELNSGEGKHCPHWLLISALLRLDGSVFLKRFPPEAKTPRTSYIDALATRIEQTAWNPDVQSADPTVLTTSTQPLQDSLYSQDLSWSNERQRIVEQILVPLMQSYVSSRDLSSFIALWYRELRRNWSDMGTDKEDRLPWTSKDLRSAFGAIFEGSFTPAKIHEQIVEYILPVKALADELSQSKNGKVVWSSFAAIAPASAALAILDALIAGVDREQIFQEHLSTWTSLNVLILQYTTFDMSEFQGRARVWSILTRLNELATRVEVKASVCELKEKLLETGVIATALSILDKSNISNVGYDYSGDAYRFVVATSSDMLSLPGLKLTAEEYIIATNSWLNRELGSAARADSTSGQQALLPSSTVTNQKGYNCISLLVRYPCCLQLSTSHQRRAIILRLLNDATTEYTLGVDPIVHSRQGQRPMKFMSLLEATVEGFLSTGSTAARDDMIQTLIEQVPGEAERIEDRPKTNVTATALNILLNISPNVIPRKDREILLDKLSTMLCSLQDLHTSVGPLYGKHDEQMRTIALIIRLLATPNPTCQLCIDADVLWSIAASFDNNRNNANHSPAPNEDAIEILETLQAFYSATFTQALSTTFERSRVFQTSFAIRAARELSTQFSSSIRLSTTVLLNSWLLTLKVDGELTEETRHAATLYHTHLVSDLTCTGKETDVSQQWVILHGLARFPFSKIGIDEFTGLAPLRNILGSVSVFSGQGGSDKTSTNLTFNQAHLSVYIDLLRAVTPQLGQDSVVLFHSNLLNQNLSARYHGLVLRGFKEWLQMLRPTQRLQIFSKILNSHSDESTSSDSQLLEYLIKAFTPEDNILTMDLSVCLDKLCTRMRNSQNMQQFCSCINSINIILRTKQWLVNQHGLDILIGSLTILASPDSGKIGAINSNAGLIYNRLCHTTNNIILLHRKRTGGRFHLLVPLLQNLLTCLFTIRGYIGLGSSPSLPPWLQGVQQPLGATHATAYSRILSTLSSPTTSSTSSRRNSKVPDLIDATKKAKIYAGQYVPYILMHYCTLQLSGSMEGSIKDALKSGIWTLMDVVDLEGMRGMNAGMGKDERVIWGELFKEWRKFGNNSAAKKRQ